MNKRISLLLFAFITSLCLWAQHDNRYTIMGEMSVDSMRYSPNVVQKLYLKRNINGEEVIIDSTMVRNRKFMCKGMAPQQVEMAFITGFDNGSIQLFLEPGTITIQPFDARFPVGATCNGTPNNNVMEEYMALVKAHTQKAIKRMTDMEKSLPDSIRKDDKAFYPYQYAVYHSNSIFHQTDIMRFVRNHLDSEATLYIMRHNLFPIFSAKVMERQYLRAVSPRLRTHSIYTEMTNLIKAANLKEGAPAPDIAGTTPDGKELKLSDLKGKYVLLDFWASWCGPCRREFPYLKQALETSAASDKFVVLSYSIDDKKKDWTDCIDTNNLKHNNWHHMSTLKGWSSDAVTLFNVSAVPHTVLLNPQGAVVAFNLRGDALVTKVKNIVSGIETYE